MYGRVDMSAVTQEGRQVRLKDHALVLAPVGEASSGRVLWLKSRSLHTRASVQDCLGPISGPCDSAVEAGRGGQCGHARRV